MTALERSHFAHMYNIFDIQKWKNLGPLVSEFRDTLHEEIKLELGDGLKDSPPRSEKSQSTENWLASVSVNNGFVESVAKKPPIMEKKKPPIMEKTSVGQVTAKEAAELVSESLDEYRAIGTVNATSEFSAYFKRLKMLDEQAWNFEKFTEHLRKPFVFNDLKRGLPVFLNIAFTTIDHPLVAFLAGKATFKFNTMDNQQLIFKIQVEGYQQFSLILSTQLPPNTRARKGKNRRRTKRLSDLRITQMHYASPWGLKNVLEDYWQETGLELKSAVFTRPGFGFDFIDSLAYLYREPTMAELIPLYFDNWQFFTAGNTCDGCGRDITNPISVIKGHGPKCGRHNYKLEMSDSASVQFYIERARKNRIFLRDSPLMKQRATMYSSLQPNSRANLLAKLRSERELSQDQISAMIDKLIMKNYVYKHQRRTGMPMGRNRRRRY